MAPSALDPVPIPRKAKGLPKVPDLDSRTVTTDEVVQALIVAGGCILRHAATPDQLAAIEADTRPWIEEDLPWKGEGFPEQTRRVCGLAGKSKAFTETVICNRLLQDVSAVLLSSTFTMWNGDKKVTSVARPQLNNTVVFSIGPGAGDQGLHRDDIIHHNHLPPITASEYKIGRDVGIGYFIAGKQTTKANGATRFIPGSHLWGPLEPQPDESLCVYAELEPGDAFIMLSSAYHGGSANTTVDEERLVYSCFMAKGLLKQEENQYLANDTQKIVDMYDIDTLKILGYDMVKPGLGWVNFDTPLRVLLGDKAVHIDSLY
ncbi:hypothetical protein A1O3_07580 [Capronia epimyces CBS 606.96]|uniref:Phytanoyl-CoA dioxygenase n=1 Tax=Capronia epimyces CBS 606.96 TaxID=1182542 RepID=W9XVB5_9EURO|nr:uncharacterized protein A1O3_07580 [Capronia epimyces CBS 606.96]EXJ81290.1 hypothetical protein A1O3_07580 [Capronia epimyces CBS 606.96]